MAQYKQQKKQALYLYHEDLEMLSALGNDALGGIIRGLAIYSQRLAEGEAVDPEIPEECTERFEIGLFKSMAYKAKRDQENYINKCIQNAKNRAKANKTTVDGGRPTETVSETVSETPSVSSSVAHPDFVTKNKQETETDDDKAAIVTDSNEFVKIVEKIASSGIKVTIRDFPDLQCWLTEFGYKSMVIACDKAFVHGATSLGYIKTILENDRNQQQQRSTDANYTQQPYIYDDLKIKETLAREIQAFKN